MNKNFRDDLYAQFITTKETLQVDYELRGYIELTVYHSSTYKVVGDSQTSNAEEFQRARKNRYFTSRRERNYHIFGSYMILILHWNYIKESWGNEEMFGLKRRKRLEILKFTADSRAL